MARAGSRRVVVRSGRLAAALVVIAGALGACSATASAQLPALGTLLKPTVTSVGVPEGWVASADVSVSVGAQGSLLGVRSIELAAPVGSVPRVRTYPCCRVT
jgi:hypothetical protein